MELYFITSNKGKLKEIKGILGNGLKSKAISVDELQEVEVSKVVEDKAIKAYYVMRKPVMVEDTGLYINSFNKFPGALVKWMLLGVGNRGICKMLDIYKDRSASAETCISFYDGHSLKTFSGRINGTIAREPRGDSGFGWDSIFVPIGEKVTFAEMSLKRKNKISMRGKAALQLKRYLNARMGD